MQVGLNHMYVHFESKISLMVVLSILKMIQIELEYCLNDPN